MKYLIKTTKIDISKIYCNKIIFMEKLIKNFKNLFNCFTQKKIIEENKLCDKFERTYYDIECINDHSKLISDQCDQCKYRRFTI